MGDIHVMAVGLMPQYGNLDQISKEKNNEFLFVL